MERQPSRQRLPSRWRSAGTPSIFRPRIRRPISRMPCPARTTGACAYGCAGNAWWRWRAAGSACILRVWSATSCARSLLDSCFAAIVHHLIIAPSPLTHTRSSPPRLLPQVRRGRRHHHVAGRRVAAACSRRRRHAAPEAAHALPHSRGARRRPRGRGALRRRRPRAVAQPGARQQHRCAATCAVVPLAGARRRW